MEDRGDPGSAAEAWGWGVFWERTGKQADQRRITRLGARVQSGWEGGFGPHGETQSSLD